MAGRCECFTLGLAAAVVCAGCGLWSGETLPDTLPELQTLAVQQRDAAQAARASRSPEVAATSAVRAEAAAEKAAGIVAGTIEPVDAERLAAQETAVAARAARRFARLADEDRQLAELLDSWRATAYRTARDLSFPAACQGLALAAEQAAKTDPASLPEPVRHSAEQAADVARTYAGRQPLANGQPDWTAVAGDLRGLAAAPPPELACGLAAAYLLLGQKRFALYELATVDPDGLSSDELRSQFHLVRGIALSVNSLPLLGVEEVEKSPGLATDGAASQGAEVLAGAHLLLAYLHLESGEYEQADRATVRALQVWPNNPIGVFLTGERLAASGEFEQAADSLEAAARGTEAQWLAARVARRARELRDDPHSSGTLLHDGAFLRDAVLHSLSEAAQKSDAARAWNESLDAARSLSKRILDRIPGVGTESDTAADAK